MTGCDEVFDVVMKEISDRYIVVRRQNTSRRSQYRVGYLEGLEFALSRMADPEEVKELLRRRVVR